MMGVYVAFNSVKNKIMILETAVFYLKFLTNVSGLPWWFKL